VPRTWETFELGEVYETAPLTVTEAHLVNWSSLTGDWVRLHTDAEYGRASVFGERIAHGPLTMSLALGLGTRLGILDEVVAWLGLDRLRAHAPVLIGDTIRAVIEFTIHRETSKPDRGLSTLTYSVLNQRAEKVMDFESSVLIRREPVLAVRGA
jgi:itaconyl-CoA hydratase